MTGKAYHLTTLGALQRHSARLNTSHWLALLPNGEPVPAIGEPDSSATELPETAQILALIEADEGAHLALEADAEFRALAHPWLSVRSRRRLRKRSRRMASRRARQRSMRRKRLRGF